MFRLLVFFGMLLSAHAGAQTYTLQQCIDTALVNNIPVQQTALDADAAAVNWRQSKTDLLPFVNAEIFHGLYQGRSIDPVSNGYVNQNLGSANYQLNSGVVVFNGGALRNSIRQTRAAYAASRAGYQQARDNLVLDVIIAYLQVLNMEDQLAFANAQAAVSRKQVERLEVLNSKGAIPPSDLSDVRGQLMNDQLAIVNAQNNLETFKLDLLQLMGKPYDKEFKVQRIDVATLLEPYGATAEQVYGAALREFSLVKAVDLQRESLAYGVKAARGALAPTVSLGGGLNTNYSSVAQNATGKIPYRSQLSNNISTSVGIGVSIPIFNRMRARNTIKLADLELRRSELEADVTRQRLRQQVEQAYLLMTNAYNRYLVLQEQVKAYRESFKAAEVRYNAGVGTSIDYLAAKDRLDRANINFTNAQYDFVLRKRVLDYYSTAGGIK